MLAKGKCSVQKCYSGNRQTTDDVAWTSFFSHAIALEVKCVNSEMLPKFTLVITKVSNFKLMT